MWIRGGKTIINKVWIKVMFLFKSLPYQLSEMYNIPPPQLSGEKPNNINILDKIPLLPRTSIGLIRRTIIKNSYGN